MALRHRRTKLQSVPPCYHCPGDFEPLSPCRSILTIHTYNFLIGIPNSGNVIHDCVTFGCSRGVNLGDLT